MLALGVPQVLVLRYQQTPAEGLEAFGICSCLHIEIIEVIYLFKENFCFVFHYQPTGELYHSDEPQVCSSPSIADDYRCLKPRSGTFSITL